MKNLKRIIFWIIFLALICLLVYLYINWVTIVKDEFKNINLVIYIILFVIFLYYTILYVIRPTYIKWFKLINTFIWLWIIFVSQYFIANSWIDKIFYWDILCLIWIVLTIIWPTNLLISKKDQQEKDLEIIEI